MARSGRTTEKGRYTKTRKALKALDGLRLDVGYFAGIASPDSTFTLPEIAAIQEFGSKRRLFRGKRIPERSFMRSTYDKFRNIYSEAFVENGFLAALGKITPEIALRIVGEDYKSDVVNKITGIRSPRNAPRTVKKKGFDNPLIHTGTMRASIKVRVLRRGI